MVANLNTVIIYYRILTPQSVVTAVNYRGIFITITLAPRCLKVKGNFGTSTMITPGKAKSRHCLGMLRANKLRHNSLNVMKLENYGPTGECLNNNH